MSKTLHSQLFNHKFKLYNMVCNISLPRELEGGPSGSAHDWHGARVGTAKAYTHSYCTHVLLPSSHCDGPSVQEELGTCACCHCRRRRIGAATTGLSQVPVPPPQHPESRNRNSRLGNSAKMSHSQRDNPAGLTGAVTLPCIPRSRNVSGTFFLLWCAATLLSCCRCTAVTRCIITATCSCSASCYARHVGHDGVL